jgi:hypothetical protein
MEDSLFNTHCGVAIPLMRVTGMNATPRHTNPPMRAVELLKIVCEHETTAVCEPKIFPSFQFTRSDDPQGRHMESACGINRRSVHTHPLVKADYSLPDCAVSRVTRAGIPNTKQANSEQ